MFDLKAGNTVMHMGQKRTIIFVRQFCGGKMLHLSGYVPMVPAYLVKPVLTVRDGIAVKGPKYVG